MSVHHYRVARRDHLKNQPRCQRRSTILTSTKMTSTSTGMLCCQRLGFFVYKNTPDNHTVDRPLPNLCPRRTACLSRSGETLASSRALGEFLKLHCLKFLFFAWGSPFSKLLLYSMRNKWLLLMYISTIFFQGGFTTCCTSQSRTSSCSGASDLFVKTS